MAKLVLTSFTKEATVLEIEIPNKNLMPALVGLGVGVLVYAILKKQ